MTLFSISEVDLLTGFLVMVRVLSMIATSPVFGNRNIPPRIRLVFAIFLTLVLVPVVPEARPLSQGLAELAVRIAHETFIGVSIGFLVTTLFSVVAIAGQLIGTSAGMQLAQQFDPTLQTQVTSLVMFKSMVLMLVFLSLDLHHVVLRGMVYSFTAIPPGGGYGGARAGFYLVKLFDTVFQTAFIMALPVLLVVLLINLSMAIIARVAPNMNVFFSVGSQVNEVAALVVLALSLPVIVQLLNSMFSGMEQNLADLIRQFR
jgi:flagellar biosynthetic protein FliR